MCQQPPLTGTTAVFGTDWHRGVVCSAGTFAVGIVITQRPEAILTAAAGSRLQVHAVGVLHTGVVLGAEVITYRMEVKG